MSKMKFMKGDIVEVRRVDSSNFHSWFRARVISGDKYSYKVQYENVSNADGKSIVEDVYAEAVRSESPDINSTKMLAIRHMIEPYDTRLSKSRKVVKTLRRRPLVKLMETQQQETYQMISQGEKWIHKDKGDRDLLMETGFQPPKKSYNGFQVQNQSMKMNAGKQKYGQPEAKLYPHKCSTYNAKRKRGSQMHFVNNEDFLKTEAAPHKRRSKQSFRQQGECAQSSYPILEKVDTFPFPRKHVGEECVCLSSFEERINQSVEGAHSGQSSVGSNSSYLSIFKLHSDRKHSNRPIVDSHLDDAQSSCESPNRRKTEPMTEKGIAAKVHNLELCAYRKTIRAFFASGCLTWEREGLLTDLRLSLHISHDEHLSELACLCPAQAA